jgi:FlaA1/EpsC-like NDP-sugar epimerase
VYCGASPEKVVDVCGIIDDDFALHHLTVYGFKVHGGLADIERIYKRTPFDKIVIALKNLPEERKNIILDFAEQKNIAVQIFTCSEQELFVPAEKTDQAKK